MEENQKNLMFKNITIIILSILLCFAGIALVYQNKVKTEQITSIQEESEKQHRNIIDQNKQIVALNLEVYNNKNQIDFMNEYVAICPSDGSGLYHKYGCKKLDLSSFMIYNTEQAPNEGYSPCRDCYNNTTSESNTDTEIVYITNNGNKYHREWCSYLKTKKAIEKSKAIKKGYEACSLCNP